LQGKEGKENPSKVAKKREGLLREGKKRGSLRDETLFAKMTTFDVKGRKRAPENDGIKKED